LTDSPYHFLNLAGGILLLVMALLALFKPGVWVRWLANYYQNHQLSEENKSVVWFLRFIAVFLLGFSFLVLRYA